MAIKRFNAVSGFSVGNDVIIDIVDSNANVIANSLTVSATANLGSVSNVVITGGSLNQVLSTDGAGNLSWATSSGAISYVVKTANYTATTNQGVLADTSAGSFTVTLPATPSAGALVIVADSGASWSTNNLTVGRNGSTISGVAENLICDITGTSVQLIYDGTTWEVYAQIGGNGGTAVTLSGTQTLTNKTLTSPVIDSGTANGVTYLNGSKVLTSSSNLTFDSTTFQVVGTVSATSFTGSATGLTGIPGANVTGTVANATYATTSGSATTATSATTAGTVTTNAQPNITSVGTLTGLTIGNATANSVFGNGTIILNSGLITGNGSGLSQLSGGNITGQVGNALVAGTVYTNAQPNITSVGTLTSLGVNGTITAVAFTANTGVFTGNGSGLSAITGANVTGTVANATYATTSGSATSATTSTTAGTVTTNAQPNITSVGTLTGVTVSGSTTLSGGTSTGVAYLNGSKVLTTGTALTFDGANLSVTGVASATDFNSTSDRTKKTNIVTIENALAKVQKLRGVEFDWINTGEAAVGLIAQEVAEVIPQVVHGEEGNMTLGYSSLVGLLIESIKEQQTQITDLQMEVQQLHNVMTKCMQNSTGN